MPSGGIAADAMEGNMNLDELNKVAQAMVAPGRGILAADESSGTIKKRFDAIGVESTEDSRRDYREMLFRSAEGMKHISGVILYDETIWQKAKDGTPLVELIKKAGAIPGIKVDEGTKPLPFCPGELITIGLDKLADRLPKYYEQGRALRQMARRHRHRQGHSDRQLHQGQCACVGALRRALSGGADCPDRRTGSIDGWRSRHRSMLSR
jgi:fructose-bisphosphate aldolase class 1